MITEKEMIFEPLNDQLKGFYNYMDGDFRKNTKMGFIINFKDVVMKPEILITKRSSQGLESDDQTFYLRIDLCHTGQKYMVKDPTISSLYQKFENYMCPMASIALKINNKSLVGDLIHNDKRKERITKLQELITKGFINTVRDEQSFTNVPCFDLHFFNIIKGPFQNTLLEKEVIDKESEEIDEGEKDYSETQLDTTPTDGEITENLSKDIDEPTIQKLPPFMNMEETQEEVPIMSEDYVSPIKDIVARDLHDNFNLIAKLFGLKSSVKSILELQNQSLSNLVRDFPELQELDHVEIIENLDIMQKTQSIDNKRANSKYFEYTRQKDSSGNFKDFVEKSDILDIHLQKKLELEIASYYIGGGWTQLYSTYNDGRSYNT